jgi:hypothetical protein
MEQDQIDKGNIRQEQALRFILGGNALFTLKSTKTGMRYTYKVLIDSRNEEQLKVFVLNGSDNTSNYRQIGYIVKDGNMPMFKDYSVHTRDMACKTAFDHVLLNLCIELYMPSLEIWHEGRCCRCGRVLTVPESIENGIGPECAFKDGRFNL